MKKIEWKLISELMKNSRRSDRELAQAIGVSQPTVSRALKKMEKEGYIKEYTMIPDFHKLGYEILALTFVKLKRGLGVEEIEKARKTAKERLRPDSSLEIVMVDRGTGLGYDGVFLSFHENYTSYLKFKNALERDTHLESSMTESFLISLKDVHFRPMTFTTLAKHLQMLKEKEKE